MPQKSVWTITSLICLLSLTGAGFIYVKRHDLDRALERASLPEAVNYTALTSNGSSAPLSPDESDAPSPSTDDLPTEINLAIPFTSQAPFAQWVPPYKEFCEEASVLMTVRYLQGQTIATPEVADEGLLDIKAFEDTHFGYYQDTTAEETATILREHFDIDNVTLLQDPTVTNIKQALAQGKPVIMPAAGRQLHNPFFQQPGPIYHMLVIKGYTDKNQFIVNDPGTRRGADFLYDETVIMEAMHDWRSDAQVDLGDKVVIIVG